jgi:hypothetical protein
MTVYSIKAAASAPIPPTNAPIPAVAIAPEPSAAVVAAAAADSLGVADAESEWPEWPECPPSSLSVVLDHSALKLAVELEHASPIVSFEPVTKLTAAHYSSVSARTRTSQCIG